jgi:hypothetical protein
MNEEMKQLIEGIINTRLTERFPNLSDELDLPFGVFSMPLVLLFKFTNEECLEGFAYARKIWVERVKAIKSVTAFPPTFEEFLKMNERICGDSLADVPGVEDWYIKEKNRLKEKKKEVN